MDRTWNTSWPSRLKISGCSVVSQTRWRMVVFPALARPMIRTRKRSVRLRTFCARLWCLSISSSLWNLLLERDICRRDAWDGGSGEKRYAAVGTVLFGHAGSATGVTSPTTYRSERSNFLRAAPLDDNERNHHRSLLASPFIQLYSQMEFLHNIHTSLTPPLSFSSTKACRFVASSTSNSINQTARDKLQVNFPRSFITVQVNAPRVTMFNQFALAINSSLIILCHAHEISVCTTPEHHLQPSAERRLYTA